MVEKRKITQNDVYVKARIMSEGVRIKGVEMPSLDEIADACKIIPEKLNFDDPEEIWRLYDKTLSTWARTSRQEVGLRFDFDGSGLKVMVQPNKYSRLELTRDGDRVTVSDGDDVLVTGTIPKRHEWLDEKLSNGLPVSTVLPVMSSEIINVVFSLSCMNYYSGRGCHYCNLFANPLSKKLLMLPLNMLRSWSKYTAEAVKVAIDNGWDGFLSVSGGALPPAHRKEYLHRLEILLSALRESLGEEIFAKQQIVYNNYVPEKFSEMYAWKELGIKATSIDLEVMDPAYFAAICPGKNAYKPHAYWKKAQEASVEIFGPYLNTTGCIVMGIEPMSSLVEGVDERLSKGVMPFPLSYYSAFGSAYWGFRPPTADWLIEASEKLADSYLKSTEFINSVAQARGGDTNEPTLSSQSSPMSLVFDEVFRRVQEMLDVQQMQEN
ncbi:MAG: hypothetical protein GY864_10460 [Desulfobacterales bacterium]|nr:hypothetical protein [Desulfobacterales bacterium]